MAIQTYEFRMKTKGRVDEIKVRVEARDEKHGKELLKLQYGNDIVTYGNKIIR